MQSLVKASFFQTFVNRLIRLVPELLILVKALLLRSQIALANFSDVLPLVVLEGHCLRRKAGYEKTRGFTPMLWIVVVPPICPQNCLLCIVLLKLQVLFLLFSYSKV